jgi:predicted  nucleic acid-binding Zn-ribbon protein
MAYEIERTSLDAHVSICQERYEHLANRLEQTDQRLARLDSMVSDIKSTLQEINQRHDNRWDRVRDAIIIGLLSVIGYFVVSSGVFG